MVWRGIAARLWPCADCGSVASQAIRSLSPGRRNIWEPRNSSRTTVKSTPMELAGSPWAGWTKPWPSRATPIASRTVCML